MTPAQALRKAADLVASGFCKGALCRNEFGEKWPIFEPEVRTYSADGALLVANRDGDAITYTSAILALGNHIGTHEISDWNDADNRTQPEVVAALRAAADKWDAENGGGE